MKIKIYKPLAAITAILMMMSFQAIAQNEKVTTTAACRMFADIENVSSVLKYVPKDKEVEVLNYSGEYALVDYEGTQGWIKTAKTTAASSLAPDNYSEPINNNTRVTNQPYDRYSALIDKYGYRTGKAIYEHKIWKGIDNNMVKDSWGKPLNVKREVNNSGTVEIWTYRKSWLMLQNGILTQWGPNK